MNDRRIRAQKGDRSMIRKRIKMSVCALLLVAAATALWLTRSPAAKVRGPSAAQNQTQEVEPLTRLDRKAKAVRGSDPSAVRDLTDGVFDTFAPVEIPPFTTESMKDRVGRAEVNYRRGTDKGIPEGKVAKVVNELADKFQIPDYAKVTPAMVRTTRVGLMLQVPNLIGRDDPNRKGHEKTSGRSINPLMSPLEATAVTMFLLQQKMKNEAFQVSHKDFFANIHKRQQQNWEARRAQRDGTVQPFRDAQDDRSMRASSNAKTDDARRAVKNAAAAMSSDTLLNLADSSLDGLGIKR